MHAPRTYRSRVQAHRLASFQVVIKETDLMVHATRELRDAARELVLEHRGYLEAHIRQHPGFLATLDPWAPRGPAPAVVEEMVAAGVAAGVGPMAAVAGAIAERVGRGLLAHAPEVIVENGGDVFLTTAAPAVVGIYAGASPLSLKFGIRVGGGAAPLAVCTSSGTVGHSLSFGRAEAACVVARACALADAAATAVANRVRSGRDITPAIEFGRTIPGVAGILVVAGDRMGAWGELEVVALGRKKG
jgi:hypothetical protein